MRAYGRAGGWQWLCLRVCHQCRAHGEQERQGDAGAVYTGKAREHGRTVPGGCIPAVLRQLRAVAECSGPCDGKDQRGKDVCGVRIVYVKKRHKVLCAN